MFNTPGPLKSIENYDLKRKDLNLKGSFAKVYLGIHQQTNKEYAIKEMDISPQKTDDGRLDLFKREIDTLTNLNHPNIIRLHEKFDKNNYLYLVFDYCSQGDLEKYMRKYNQQKLPEQEAKKIFVQIASAMMELKRMNVVHRDLKLANILISEDFTIKLADFGFAKQAGPDNVLESYCGTPLTMAPEILKNQYKYSAKCDMWSLGVILYQMVCGVAPFKPKQGGGIEELLKVIIESEKKDLVFPPTVQLSLKLKFLLKQLLMVQPSKRFSIEEVVKHDWVKEDFVSIKQNRVEASTFLKNIGTKQTKPQSEDLVISQEIIIDQIPQPVCVTQNVASHLKFLLNRLDTYLTNIKTLLGTFEHPNNQGILSKINDILSRKFYLDILLNKKKINIFKAEKTLDEILFTIFIDLYIAMLCLGGQSQLDCLNVLREATMFVGDKSNLFSSELIFSKELNDVNVKELQKLLTENKDQGIELEENYISQSFTIPSGDWNRVKSLILDRDRLIMIQN